MSGGGKGHGRSWVLVVLATILAVVGVINVVLAVRFHVLWHAWLGGALVSAAIAVTIVVVREFRTRRRADEAGRSAWRSPAQGLHATRR